MCVRDIARPSEPNLSLEKYYKILLHFRTNGVTEKVVIKFPPSLLSIPQQLENIMSHSTFIPSPVKHQVKVESPGKKSPVASTSKDSGDIFSDNHG